MPQFLLMWKKCLCVQFLFCILFLGCNGKIIIFDGGENVDEFSDYELPFSKRIVKYGIEGNMVIADPPNACTPISEPPETNDTLNWFVLIAGNLCDYSTKIMNSELAGYTAAVIYNIRGRDAGTYPSNQNYMSNISAVLIRTSSGLIIRDNYLYSVDPRYSVLIYPNNTFNIMTFLVLFAILAGIFLLVMFSFVIIRYVQQMRNPHESLLTTHNLRQLETTQFRKGDPYETCAICLEDFKSNDKLRILPCSHGYHSKCIDPWLTRSQRICPVCKQAVVLKNEAGSYSQAVENRATETTPLLSSSHRENALASSVAESTSA